MNELDSHFPPDWSQSLEFNLTSEAIGTFASLTGDVSSLHMDETYARGSLYGRRVAHGMLPIVHLAGCAALVPEGWSARVSSLSTRFGGPVYAGDRVRLQVRLDECKASASTVSFLYSAHNLSSAKDVAAGKLVLEYAPSNDSQTESRRDGSPRAGLLCDELTERRAALEDLHNGDQESFDFSVTERSLHGLDELLTLTSCGSPAQGTARVSSALDAQTLLGLCMLSTLVGMRLPGEAATFLSLSTTVAESLEVGTRYRLTGEVAHLSRGTRMLKSRITIARPDSPDAASVTGTVSSLVNVPARPRQSMQDLRAAAEFGIRDSVVIITGASGAIGATTAKLMALLGASVVVNYRRQGDEAERIASEIRASGGRALPICADVTDAGAVKDMVDRCVSEFGGVHVLVNNAVRDFREIAYNDLVWDEIEKDIAVAVKGAFLCSKAVTPHMESAGGGSIINISSIYAEAAPRDQLKYVVAKAALEGLTRALATELAGLNIRVNSVVPSFVDTDLASRMHEGISRKRARLSAMGRNAKPEDVAHAVAFLASAFSSYTTGQRILITGGGRYVS